MFGRLFGKKSKDEKLRMGIHRNLSHLKQWFEYLNEVNSKSYPARMWDAVDAKWDVILRTSNLSFDDLHKHAVELAEYTYEIMMLVQKEKWNSVLDKTAEIIALRVQIQIEAGFPMSATINLSEEMPDSASIENFDEHIQKINAEIKTLKNILCIHELKEKISNLKFQAQTYATELDGDSSDIFSREVISQWSKYINNASQVSLSPERLQQEITQWNATIGKFKDKINKKRLAEDKAEQDRLEKAGEEYSRRSKVMSIN